MLFYIQIPIFLLLSVICFTLPGIYVLNKSGVGFHFWEKTILGTSTGFVLFTLFSYLLFMVRMEILLIPVILVTDFLLIKSIRHFQLKVPLPKPKYLSITLLVLLIGVIGQLAIISPSGRYINGDLVFYSSHGHDSMWHIALINQLQKGYPLKNPVLAGEQLVNYHFFSDIAPAGFNWLFHFSVIDLYFRFFPLLFSVLLGSLVFILGHKLTSSYTAGLWCTFFTFFGGGFGYIVTFLKDRTLSGEVIFGSTQIQSSIGNPPLIASLIVILTAIYLILLLLPKTNRLLFILAILITSSLALFKIYASVVMLLSLGILSLWLILKHRNFRFLALSTISGIISLLLYIPNSSRSSAFLIFEPWWFIRTMIVASDKLNWLDLELRRQTYFYEGNYKRVYFLELVGFLIFLFGNLGTRVLSFLLIFKKWHRVTKNDSYILLASISIFSLILPLLFLQKGVAGNTIQFLQYFLLIMGIAAGIAVDAVLKKIQNFSINLFIIIVIAAASIPTQAGLIADFYSRPPLSRISQDELEALQILNNKGNPSATILTPPFQSGFLSPELPPPIWAWSDTAYVAALSKHQTYLADTEQVDIMGYKYLDKRNLLEKMFSEDDPKTFDKLARSTNSEYLYIPKPLKPKADLTKTTFKLIFSNNSVEIWEI